VVVPKNTTWLYNAFGFAEPKVSGLLLSLVRQIRISSCWEYQPPEKARISCRHDSSSSSSRYTYYSKCTDGVIERCSAHVPPDDRLQSIIPQTRGSLPTKADNSRVKLSFPHELNLAATMPVRRMYTDESPMRKKGYGSAVILR
jgi:hypothetical protein